jgi:DNA-binding PadR family transcriptional regulator
MNQSIQAMLAAGPLSELEHLILALLGEGKSNGYAIRKAMNRLKGGRWSADSGSVYRILRRLEAYGLLEEMGRNGAQNRERTEYRLTPAGEQELDHWITEIPDEMDMGYMNDSVRTRAYFLTRMEPAERLRLVKRWLSESKAYAIQLEIELAATAFNEPMRDAAYRNLHFHALARVEWLKYLLATLRQPSPELGQPSSEPEPAPTDELVSPAGTAGD